MGRQILVIDGDIKKQIPTKKPVQTTLPLYTTVNVEKTTRYILLVIQHKNKIDGQNYLIGFGFNTYNRKIITKNSISILFRFLADGLKSKGKEITIRRGLHYTVNIGCLEDDNKINDITEKHGLKNIREKSILEFDENLIDDFLNEFYRK